MLNLPILLTSLIIPLNIFTSPISYREYTHSNHTKSRIVMSTPSPTISPTPTSTPTTIATFKPKPTSIPVATPFTSNERDYIMGEINNYRKSKGLTAVQTDPYTCNFAKSRAQEISTNFSHDGFSSRINNKTLPYPSYKLVVENIARTSDYKRVVALWVNSPGHAENMQKDTPFVCVESYGDFYAYEGWKP